MFIMNFILRINFFSEMKKHIIKAVKYEFGVLNNKVNSLQVNFCELQNFIIRQKPVDEQTKIVTFHAFEAKYGYNFPFKSIANFEEFENDVPKRK